MITKFPPMSTGKEKGVLLRTLLVAKMIGEGNISVACF